MGWMNKDISFFAKQPDHLQSSSIFLILNFRRVLIEVSYLLGKSPASVC